VLEETIGLERLVGDLLHLARSDAGAHLLRNDDVDLDDIVLEAARRLHDGGLAAVDVSGVSAVRVRGDRAQLTRAVRNLADNAATTPAAR
jgi:signal transduction histidine kinase